MACLICNIILQTEIESSKNYFCKFTNEFTWKSLRQHFKIPLNIAIANQKLDFTDPNFNFCSECANIIERLCELNENLEEIQREIIRTKDCIRSKIREISALPGYDCENEDEMKLLKAWKHSDKNVEIIRDLIVGPRIHLKRVTPTKTNESSALYSSLPSNDFEHFEDDFVSNSPAPDPEIDQGDSFTEMPGTLIDVDKNQVRKCKKKKRKRKSSAEGPRNSRSSRKSFKSTAQTINAETREKLLEEFFPEQITAAPAFEDKLPESENDEGDEDLESDLIRKRRCSKRRNRKNVSYTDDVQKTSGEVKEADVKPDPDDRNSDRSSIKSGFSSEEECDDDRDEDFILPDDAVETLVEDQKAGAGVEKKMRAIGRRLSGVVPNKNPDKIKIVLESKDQYRYGENLRFTGNPRNGFKCSQCNSGRVYRTKRLVYTHIKVHMRRQHECPTCGKILNTRGGYIGHMETHREKEENSIFICEACGKNVASKTKLEGHFQRNHTSESLSDVICEFCGKHFQRKNYRGHVRRAHLRTLKYYCEFCGRDFATKATLTNHLATHSTDRPFSCDKCGQQVKTKMVLYKHMRQFHSTKPKYSTSVPESESNSDANNIKNTNPDLQCKYCGLQYNRHNNLTRHLKQIHHVNVKGLAWKTKQKKLLAKVTKQPDLVARNNLLSIPEPSSSNAIGENVISTDDFTEPIAKMDSNNRTIASSVTTTDGANGFPILLTGGLPDK